MKESPRLSHAQIPMQTVGPLKLAGPLVTGEISVPLATFETPLWPSVDRGARVSRLTAGIRAVIQDERMTRSILLEASSAADAVQAAETLRARKNDVAVVAATTSRFARLIDLHTQVVANLLYVRLEMTTGDAAGHNMVTGAADAVMSWMLKEFSRLRYVSISGNYCTDKKVSAVNGILGRGRSVIAEITVPDAICQKQLRSTAARIVDLNIKKNLLGSLVAGGLRSANAHFANMLLAFYLATGQDAANIVEGSQGFVHAEDRDGELYFACTVPHVIVGTVGSGKEHPFVRENLELLDCTAEREPGLNARRLAVIAAATVLCGELSLLAAQTNPGELMKAHRKLERRASR